MSPSHQQKDNMNDTNKITTDTTDTTKSCVRVYSFSNLYGHTTYEVFLQQDENGEFRYFTDRGGVNGSSHIELSLEQPARKVKELIRIAKARYNQGQ
jgi:hypothetical protein